jgi:hypothetical protein
MFTLDKNDFTKKGLLSKILGQQPIPENESSLRCHNQQFSGMIQ